MYHCSSGLPRWKASSEHSSHESYSTLGQPLRGLHSPAEDTGHTRRLVFQMAPRVRKDSLKGQVADHSPLHSWFNHPRFLQLP